jgi:DNA-binding response OmpR family regulator
MRVLIVDDNPDAATILAALLKYAGHESCTATDGEQALQIAADYSPHAVLLDIGRPKMNGYDVARRIRAMRDLGGIRIITYSCYLADEAKHVACGIDCHLLKPTVIEDILKAMGAPPLPPPQLFSPRPEYIRPRLQ